MGSFGMVERCDTLLRGETSVTGRRRLLRFYYGTTALCTPIVTLGDEVHMGDRAGQRPRSSSGSLLTRRYGPDRPPVFSHSAMSPIVIERSADLHMS